MSLGSLALRLDWNKKNRSDIYFILDNVIIIYLVDDIFVLFLIHDKNIIIKNVIIVQQ